MSADEIANHLAIGFLLILVYGQFSFWLGMRYERRNAKGRLRA
jgi:hypothetical protein